MLLKKLLLASTITSFSLLSVASPEKDYQLDSERHATSSSGEVLKFSEFIALRCASPSVCGTYTSSFHKATVYEKFEGGIPPRLEMRLFWNKNIPAGISAGRYKAKTLGDTCPDGSRMSADWLLNSNGAPIYAIATDCNGLRNEFDIIYLP